MGLFNTNNETKEEKQKRKMQETLNKYELNNLDSEYANAVKNISLALAGNNLIELGSTLGMTSAENLTTSYLKAIVEQNFIMIRQLDEISDCILRHNTYPKVVNTRK